LDAKKHGTSYWTIKEMPVPPGRDEKTPLEGALVACQIYQEVSPAKDMSAPMAFTGQVTIDRGNRGAEKTARRGGGGSRSAKEKKKLLDTSEEPSWLGYLTRNNGQGSARGTLALDVRHRLLRE